MHSRLCAFLGLFQGRNHRWPSHLNLGKPSENHRYQWLISKKTFNGDGPGLVKPLKNHRWQWSICKKNIQWWWSGGSKTIEKPSLAMVPWRKNITIASFEKNDHRWSLAPIAQSGLFWGQKCCFSAGNSFFRDIIKNNCSHCDGTPKRQHFCAMAGFWGGGRVHFQHKIDPKMFF